MMSTDVVLWSIKLAEKLWTDPQTPQAAKVEIALTDWNPKLR